MRNPRHKSLALTRAIATLASALMLVASIPSSASAEDVTCDPSVNSSIYYCRGWQDGVGPYGSRVRFIARMMGDAYGDDFGNKIVGLGDINGDGRGDFTVWVKNKCEWRIYLGDTLISKTPYMTWPRGDPPYPCSPYPGNLAVIPDITGDGYPDLFRTVGGLPPNRKILIYSLGPAFDTLPELILADTNFDAPIGLNGEAIAGGFDLNGDGQPDFVFGDNGYFRQSPKENGRAYVYWGGTALDSIPDLIFTDTFWVGQNQPYEVGGAVAILPSLNSDSYADLVVGRPSQSFSKDPVGRVDVFFGGPDMDTVRDTHLVGPDTAWGFGCAYYGVTDFGYGTRDVGDVNQDGYDDLLVSGNGCTPAYIYYGGPDFDTTVDLRLTQPSPTANGQGRYVKQLGDIDGDGYPDFCTVQIGSDFFRGSINIHFSRQNTTGVADWTIWGQDWSWAFWEFGRSTTNVGDVDGDGFDDIGVGSATDQIDEFNQGEAFIFAGYNPDIYSGILDDPETPVPADHKLIAYVAPNPFNAATIIHLVPSFAAGRIVIYDILGRSVRSFAIAEGAAQREITWDGHDESQRELASGLYFARAQFGIRSEVHKLVLLK